MFKKIFKPKLWTPLMFEDSKIPVWLSKIAPIDIWAISFANFVFCRGKLSVTTKRHETIHFQQQLELLFLGQWILYGGYWLIRYFKHGDGKLAYEENPFEREAYANQETIDYLDSRKRYSWIKYRMK